MCRWPALFMQAFCGVRPCPGQGETLLLPQMATNASTDASPRLPRHCAARKGRRETDVSPDAQATIDYELDPDNASILVAGGGGVALNTTRRLKNMGSWVWQLQRTDVRRKVRCAL